MRSSTRRRPVTLRPLRARDLGSVMEIERVSYPRPWSENVFRAEIDRVTTHADRYYVAATLGRRLVGYAGLLLAVDDAHVTNIAVSPAYRHHGVGARLLADLGAQARRRGMASMTLEVRVSNVGAQRLYESFGFETAGIRQKYYENVDDALVMWRYGIAEADFAAVLARHGVEVDR